MDGIFAAIVSRWAALGVSHATPAAQADVAAFEARYGRRLPEDVRAYFLTLNGAQGGSSNLIDDSFYLSFWNLSEVKPLSEEAPHMNTPNRDSLFLFADHLLWCHAYALRLEPGENPSAEVVMVDGIHEISVAPSLTGFLEAYLADAEDAIFPYTPIQPPHEALELAPPGPHRWSKPRLRNEWWVSWLLSRAVNRHLRVSPQVRRSSGLEVLLGMRVDERGRPGGVHVARPCAEPALNEAAVRVGARMRFRPARVDREGVAVHITIPVTFSFR